MQRLGVICLVLFAIALGAAYVLRPEWFGQVEVCPCKNEGRVWILRSDGGNFNVQVEAARQHQVPFILDDSIRRNLIKRGELHRLPHRGSGYRVSTRQFTHSVPFYSPKTVKAFSAFAAALGFYMSAYVWQDQFLVDLNIGVPGVLTKYSVQRTCLMNLGFLI